MILTVTLNAAVDRTLTVPNFQLGHRHRASESLTLPGGEGINIARALKLLEEPVVATGLAGGGSGQRILDDLSQESILHDFVRIADTSRTSSAVVDPMAGTYTEINEWGPHVEPDELETLQEKIRYLARGADFVVLAGTLPRGISEDFYAEMIHELNRTRTRTVLDSDGEPLRLGVEAEPHLVSTSQQDAEALIGQELNEEQDFVLALDQIAEMGARNVLIAQPSSCYALVRENRHRLRYHAAATLVEPVSPAGAGDVLLAAFVAALKAERQPEDALRSAVAAANASTLEVGSGRFDPRRAGRMVSDVEVASLEAVTSA